MAGGDRVAPANAAGSSGRRVGGSRWTKAVPVFGAGLIAFVGVGLRDKAVVGVLPK
jgi:hypothetical protein